MIHYPLQSCLDQQAFPAPFFFFLCPKCTCNHFPIKQTVFLLHEQCIVQVCLPLAFASSEHSTWHCREIAWDSSNFAHLGRKRKIETGQVCGPFGQRQVGARPQLLRSQKCFCSIRILGHVPFLRRKTLVQSILTIKLCCTPVSAHLLLPQSPRAWAGSCVSLLVLLCSHTSRDGALN